MRRLSPRSRRSLLVLLALVLLVPLGLLGAASPPASTSTPAPAPVAAAVAPKDSAKRSEGRGFQGFIVAANATDFFAPEFVFRVAGWSSDWGSRKLVELAPDGKRVAAGDVIARFEFASEQALVMINDRINRAVSDASQSEIAAAQAIEGLEMARRRKEIDAETARLNLERAPALSRMQGDALRIQQRLAAFDVEAAGELLASAKASWAAIGERHARTVEAAREGKDRYDFYFGRFSVRTPTAGVVRHAFNARERRKLQKGDNVQSGMRVVSLAADETLAVRFFVPEAEASHLQTGAKVLVITPTSAEEIEATVVAVDFFPQELGFLLENDELPNAREKAVAVRASLTAAPATLAAGTEIRVRLGTASGAPLTTTTTAPLTKTPPLPLTTTVPPSKPPVTP